MKELQRKPKLINNQINLELYVDKCLRIEIATPGVGGGDRFTAGSPVEVGAGGEAIGTDEGYDEVVEF